MTHSCTNTNISFILHLNLCFQDCVRIRFIAFISFLLFTFACATSYGQNLQVPISIQAALLQKVIKFDNTIGNRSDVKILIVYNNDSRNFMNELVSQFPATFKIMSKLPTEIEGVLDDYDLAYIMPGAQTAIASLKSKKILTITGLTKYVENGDVSIGFGLLNDKPKVFVNMTSLKAEDRILAADILRIAKVYK